jgi:CheY-like chemotaxis protein
MNENTLVLLVEDDKVDAMTVRRAMKEINSTSPIRHVMNGEEALAYLRNPKNPRPSYVLLDINMPKMNGIEFLRAMRADEALRSIPVIVLTTSKEERDRVATFDQCVAGYMVKPVDYSQFVDTMKVIDGYWKRSEQPVCGQEA